MVMSMSIPSDAGAVLSMSRKDLEPLLQASRQSPRLRMIQQVQRSEGAPVQRLLNAMQPGTYIRPHRHPESGASETVVMIQGRLGIVIFDPRGKIVERIELQTGDLVDLQAGVWHTMVCLAPDTVIAEFKRGPYDSNTDKEFASWSREDDYCFTSDLEEIFNLNR